MARRAARSAGAAAGQSEPGSRDETEAMDPPRRAGAQLKGARGPAKHASSPRKSGGAGRSDAKEGGTSLEHEGEESKEDREGGEGKSEPEGEKAARDQHGRLGCSWC